MFGFNSKPVKRSIVSRDPNNQLDLDGLSLQNQTGSPYSRLRINSGADRAGQRGATARATLNYNRMSKLGSGSAAKQMQMNSFAKLKSVGSGGIRRDFNLSK
ncbi:MAG: hypothetical protein WC249_02515 [Patescibacteria group bacterium]|jgi:hypothetical protein